MTSRGITKETAERFRLGADPTDKRLTIPYLTPDGPWYVKRRCTRNHDCKDHGHGKYVYDPGIEIHLFNPQTLLTADAVVVVEGEIDAITCEQAGVPAVGFPGSQMWAKNRHWRWCFDSVNEVVVLADGDDVGLKAAQEVAASLRASVGADITVTQFPQGEDANSFMFGRDPAELLQLLDWL